MKEGPVDPAVPRYLLRAAEKRVAELEEENKILKEVLRKLCRWVGEGCPAPNTLNPTKEEEDYWRERGWEFDGFGTWAPPGYHIVRPGKIQEDE